jgi:hypothetical protein
MIDQALEDGSAGLQPSLALLGETAIAGQVSIGMSLGDVPKFLAGHVGFVKGDGRHISFSSQRANRNHLPVRSTHPWIHDPNAGWLEVGDVACHDRQIVNQRRCGDESVAVRARVGYMQPRTTPRNGRVDRENAFRKCGYDLRFQPAAQDRTLGRITPFNQQ